VQFFTEDKKLIWFHDWKSGIPCRQFSMLEAHFGERGIVAG
jgi:hypothetical protein